LGRLAVTAEVLRAEQADALIDDYEQIGEMKAEAAQRLAAAREVYEIERSRGALEGQRAGALEAARLLGEAQEAVQILVDSLEGEIALLAVSIAERILGEFDEQELILRAAKQAIADLRDDDAATLYIAPRYVGPLRERLVRDLGGVGLAIEPQPAMDDKACLISTARGSIDAGLESQLEVVRQSVRAWSRPGARRGGAV
jgi:flagellar biosynthesis/type III secretory pathway protein FliH